MKLLETYALATGLKIGEPFIYKAFYPLPFTKYITIHASSGMQSKNYSYWSEVIELITPALQKEGIQIVQIGGKDDQPLPGCANLNGGLSLHQTAYVLSNSIAHLCNDTFSAHVAGFFGIPLISIYGATTVKNHSPYFFNKETTIFIEADRGGNMPTYASEEKVKAVDSIMPETIANAFLSLAESSTSRKSLYLGEHYNEMVIEYVPDFPLRRDAFSDGVINMRMDYVFDEQMFARITSERKVNVITNAPIKIELLQALKRNINQFSYEISEDTDPDYINRVKSLGLNVSLVTREADDTKVNDLRLKFFDFNIFREKIITKKSLALADIICDNVYYKSNKFLLSGDKIFLSKADWLMGKYIPDISANTRPIVDSEDFWQESKHFYIFNQ